jgi:signal transduction histidine kinase
VKSLRHQTWLVATGKVLRTTAFKLSLAYLVIFAIGAGVVLTSLAYNLRTLVDEQIAETVEAEIRGLSDLYRRGGIRGLVDAVERRARQPNAFLYLVTTFTGESIVGNVAALPPGVLQRPGIAETTYERSGETAETHRALARIFVLQGGFRLLVGHDLEDRDTLARVMSQALVTSLIWLVLIGTAGGLIVATRVLRRVDGMNASAVSIMDGDLTQRLPVNGSGDELDRLAQNLNAMLDRIADLMMGLKQVSDNIAHDLKTPLTRLRNGVEQALRTAERPEEYRAALDKVLDDSDGIIRIFNALLMIARLEAGSGRDTMTSFDAALVVEDVIELYEPSAEEDGLAISAEVEPELTIRGNRELVGQALANLVDNAIKYGVPEDGVLTKGSIDVTASRRGAAIEISVADHGPGIPEVDRVRVLDRFVRLEGARSRPGSGLGLSLAAAVVRLHGGSLRLEDNNPGLCVIMTFAAAQPMAPPLLEAGRPDDHS